MVYAVVGELFKSFAWLKVALPKILTYIHITSEGPAFKLVLTVSKSMYYDQKVSKVKVLLMHQNGAPDSTNIILYYIIE